MLGEVDNCIIGAGFKKDLGPIISQLLKQRQTLLSSLQPRKVSFKDLARLSLKDPEHTKLMQNP